MNLNPQAAQHQTLMLWACPIGVHDFEEASEVNPLLTRVLKSMRALDPQADQRAAFYASNDDLLTRIRIPEWQRWVEFLVHSIGKTAREANAETWPADSENLAVQIRGLWCQISSDGVHHDVHSHGNCSWSGVYVVQVDPGAERESHRVYGQRNGVTRFYGPYFDRLAGASMDYGNAYLQRAHLDLAPLEGRLIVFPSWLHHQAMPYQGSRDRIILSFNASIHRPGGDQWSSYTAS